MQKKYNVCFDVLTIISCLMVVFFHMNRIVYQYSDTVSWKISVAERCIVYSAIPIFFMLSGAKLLGYRSRYSTKEYIKKRLLRVGIPFLFWNAFSVIFYIAFGIQPAVNSGKDFISMFFNAEFQSAYWFFYSLFAVYAAIPVLSLILQAKNHRKYLWYIVAVSFTCNWILMPLCKIAGIRYNEHILMPVCGGYLMYAVLGYLLSTQQLRGFQRWVLYIAAIFSGIFAFSYTVISSAEIGQTNTFLFSYNHFPSALTGAAIFVLVKHLFDKPLQHSRLQQGGKCTQLIRTVSGCCMGVWLTHNFVIQAFASLTDLSISSYLWRFILPFIVFFLCLAGTYLAKKIPIIKHIV